MNLGRLIVFSCLFFGFSCHDSKDDPQPLEWQVTWHADRPVNASQAVALRDGGLAFTGFTGFLSAEGDLQVVGPRSSSAHHIGAFFDGVVARLSPTGDLEWFATAGGPSSQFAGAITELVDGHIVVGGQYNQQLVVQGAGESLTLDPQGVSDLYLANFDARGEPSWITRVGKADDSSMDDEGGFRSLTALDTGGLLVHGYFDGDVTVSPPNSTETDAIIYAPESSTYMGFLNLSSSGRFEAARVTTIPPGAQLTGWQFASDGSAVIATRSTINDFSGGDFTPGDSDRVIMLDPQRAVRWASTPWDCAVQPESRLAVRKILTTRTAGVALAGELHGSCVVRGAAGEASLVGSEGGQDAAVCRFDAQGLLLGCFSLFGKNVGDVTVTGLVELEDQGFIVGGTFETFAADDTTDRHGSRLVAVGEGHHAFIVRVSASGDVTWWKYFAHVRETKEGITYPTEGQSETQALVMTPSGDAVYWIGDYYSRSYQGCVTGGDGSCLVRLPAAIKNSGFVMKISLVLE